MNKAEVHGNMKKLGKTGTGRDLILFLMVLTGLFAVPVLPFFREASIALAQLDSSRPQSAFRLVGTIEGGPFTGAVIDDSKNSQAFYFLNDKLPDDSRIVKVQSNHIVLKGPDGTMMELYTTPGAGGGSASAATAVAIPSTAPRRVDQPAPARRVDPRVRPKSSEDAEGTTGKRPHLIGRQDPDQQDAQVQDPNNPYKWKGGNRGRRNMPRSGDEN